MKRMELVEKKSNVNDIWTKIMKKENSRITLFVMCVDNSEYPASLELHKMYQALPDEDAALDGDLRIIDESGEDYLYPAEWFVFVELPEEAEQSLLQAA